MGSVFQEYPKWVKGVKDVIVQNAEEEARVLKEKADADAALVEKATQQVKKEMEQEAANVLPSVKGKSKP